jgi:hypothetical protein
VNRLKKTESSTKPYWLSRKYVIEVFKILVVNIVGAWCFVSGYPFRWILDMPKFFAGVFGVHTENMYFKEIGEEFVNINNQSSTVQAPIYFVFTMLLVLALIFIPTSSGKKKDNNDA